MDVSGGTPGDGALPGAGLRPGPRVYQSIVRTRAGQGDQKVAGRAAPRRGQAGLTTPTCITHPARHGRRGGHAQIANTLPPKNFGDSAVGNSARSAHGAQLLLQFDLAPSRGATITNAHVTLRRPRRAGHGQRAPHHRPWTESTVTWQSFGGAFSRPPRRASATPPPIRSSTYELVQKLGQRRGAQQRVPARAGDHHNHHLPRPARPPTSTTGPASRSCYTPLACPGRARQLRRATRRNGCETASTPSPNCGACGVPAAARYATTSWPPPAPAPSWVRAGFGNCNGPLPRGRLARPPVITTAPTAAPAAWPAPARQRHLDPAPPAPAPVVTCAHRLGDCDGNAGQRLRDPASPPPPTVAPAGVACALRQNATSTLRRRDVPRIGAWRVRLATATATRTIRLRDQPHHRHRLRAPARRPARSPTPPRRAPAGACALVPARPGSSTAIRQPGNGLRARALRERRHLQSPAPTAPSLGVPRGCDAAPELLRRPEERQRDRRRPAAAPARPVPPARARPRSATASTATATASSTNRQPGGGVACKAGRAGPGSRPVPANRAAQPACLPADQGCTAAAGGDHHRPHRRLSLATPCS